MAHEIKLEGLVELKKGLARRIEMDAVKKVVRVNGSQLQRKAQRNADFKKGYQTGNLKRNIMLELTDDDMTAVVEPTADYSVYVEYGTRHMDAQPYLRPAYVDQLMKFKSDMQRLMN